MRTVVLLSAQITAVYALAARPTFGRISRPALGPNAQFSHAYFGPARAPAAQMQVPVLLSPLLSPPADGYDGAVAAGVKKAGLSATKIFALAVMSGCHIGFGAFLMLSVGGACPQIAATNPGLQKIIAGAFGIPFGLLMTIVTGAELFTGNTALVTAALLEGKVDGKELVKSWVASYAGDPAG